MQNHLYWSTGEKSFKIGTMWERGENLQSCEDGDGGKERMLSSFADDRKLGGMADTPERCAAIQSILSMLEKQADKDLMYFNKRKCRSCPLGGMT